jgi:hypothetical protein
MKCCISVCRFSEISYNIWGIFCVGTLVMCQIRRMTCKKMLRKTTVIYMVFQAGAFKFACGYVGRTCRHSGGMMGKTWTCAIGVAVYKQ